MAVNAKQLRAPGAAPVVPPGPGGRPWTMTMTRSSLIWPPRSSSGQPAGARAAHAAMQACRRTLCCSRRCGWRPATTWGAGVRELDLAQQAAPCSGHLQRLLDSPADVPAPAVPPPAASSALLRAASGSSASQQGPRDSIEGPARCRVRLMRARGNGGRRRMGVRGAVLRRVPRRPAGRLQPHCGARTAPLAGEPPLFFQSADADLLSAGNSSVRRWPFLGRRGRKRYVCAIFVFWCSHACFSCGHRGHPGAVAKCSMGRCGRHYHLACIRCQPAWRPLARPARRSSARCTFKCPLHYCAACGQSGKCCAHGAVLPLPLRIPRQVQAGGRSAGV